MTPPPASRFPRRAPRPAALRPAARSAGPPPLAPPAVERPALTEPTSAERVRLRRLVRVVLIGVIVAQSIALVLVLSPTARAQWAVQVVNMFEVTGGTTLSGVRQTLQDAVERLTRLRELGNENDVRLSSGSTEYIASDDVDDVTYRPLELSTISGPNGETGISFSDTNPVGSLQTVIPGAVPWGDYAQERRASTDMVLLTLRGGMQSLHDFHESIVDDTRLMEISEAAGQSNVSERTLQQLQIQAQLETARQVQALRAQQALQTSLYVVTESHRVGLEGRQFAQDTAVDCDVIADVFAGPLGGLLCGGGGAGLPLP